jgi:hypothetical protein
MYGILPFALRLAVTFILSSAFAMPKSASFVSPERLNKMFEGEMSR